MLLLGSWTFITIQSHRRSGPGLVRHQRCGGDWAEQAGLRPGLWGHPQAPVLWRSARAQHLHATAPRPVLRGDPEEAGGCGRATEGEGISFISVKSAWSQRRTLPHLQHCCGGFHNNQLTSCDIFSSPKPEFLLTFEAPLQLHGQCPLSPSSARRLNCWSTSQRRGSTSVRWSRRPLRKTTTSSRTPRKNWSRRWRPSRRTGRLCWLPCWRGCRKRSEGLNKDQNSVGNI